MKNSIEKVKAEEIIFKGSKGLFINGEKYGACITKLEINGPDEIVVYATKWYKKDKFYDRDFHKVEELEKYENIKVYVEK